MFKQSLNRAIISLTLWPEGPLLVKTDVPAGNHAENADVEMFCVRTLHGPASETVYLPGSSLKGMLRAYCEAIARTIGLWCCPLFDEEKRCSKPLENEPDTAKRYRESCSICRTFGSTALASRMRIADAYPTPETWERANRTEIRNHVAIDRVLGSSAKGALFAVEVVTGGCFPTQITLENFELWQLGLLALALRDLEAGQIPMGYGKSRGMGNLGAAVTSVTVEYPGFVPVNDGKAMRRLGRTEPWSLQVAVSDDPAKVKMRVYGVGCFVDEDDAQRYGFLAKDQVEVPGPASEVSGEWLAVSCRFLKNTRVDQVTPLFRACVDGKIEEVIGQEQQRQQGVEAAQVAEGERNERRK